MAAALVNIKIPLLLGDLVNVVSNMTKEATTDFINNLRIPAIKLMMFYSLQVKYNGTYSPGRHPYVAF